MYKVMFVSISIYLPCSKKNMEKISYNLTTKVLLLPSTHPLNQLTFNKQGSPLWPRYSWHIRVRDVDADIAPVLTSRRSLDRWNVQSAHVYYLITCPCDLWDQCALYQGPIRCNPLNDRRNCKVIDNQCSACELDIISHRNSSFMIIWEYNNRIRKNCKNLVSGADVMKIYQVTYPVLPAC